MQANSENNIGIRPVRHPELVSGSHSRSILDRLSWIVGRSGLKPHADEILNIAANFETPRLTLQDDVGRDTDCNDVRPGKSSHFSPLTSHLFAFTLSEVLLTLGIIGVVAALTLPTLIKNTQDAQYKSAFKKEYSVATSAFKQAAFENGGTLVGYSAITGNAHKRSNDFRDIVKPYLSYIKECDSSQIAQCSPVSKYKTYDNKSFPESWNWGQNPSSYPHSALILNDGSIWRFFAYYDVMGSCTCDWITNTKNACGEIAIDTNGAKKPNQAGYDLFEFYVASDGTIVPMGTQNDVHKNAYSKTIGYTRSNYMLDISN